MLDLLRLNLHCYYVRLALQLRRTQCLFRLKVYGGYTVLTWFKILPVLFCMRYIHGAQGKEHKEGQNDTKRGQWANLGKRHETSVPYF